MLEVGKKITELRVCDLKDELEKRKLETVGPKTVLIERLERVRSEKGYKTAAPVYNEFQLQALKEEGVDPSTFLITPAVKAKKQMPLPMKGDESDVQIKEEPIDPEEVQEGGDDANGDEQDTAHHADEDGHEIDQVGDVDDVCVILDDDDDDDNEEEERDGDKECNQEQNANSDATEKNAVKEEIVEPSGDDDLQEENTGDTVTIDNDESINLTIGEDEQQLLHDEVRFE